MKFKALSIALMLLMVLFTAVPALAFWDQIGSAVANGTLNVDRVENNVSTLKDGLTSQVPRISSWLETIITFLTTYLGDLFTWLN